MKVCVFTLICASCADLVTVYHNERLKGVEINIVKKLQIACMRITVLSIQSIALQFWGKIPCNFETATESGTII